jgi:hypothetical protein
MNVDPRDWGVYYVYSIFDLLINHEQVKYQSLSDWDKNVTEKMSFIAFFMKFFGTRKGHTLAVFYN